MPSPPGSSASTSSAPDRADASVNTVPSGSGRASRPMRTLFSAVTGQRNGSCMTTATCPHRSSVAIRAVSRPSHATLPEVGR